VRERASPKYKSERERSELSHTLWGDYPLQPQSLTGRWSKPCLYLTVGICSCNTLAISSKIPRTNGHGVHPFDLTVFIRSPSSSVRRRPILLFVYSLLSFVHSLLSFTHFLLFNVVIHVLRYNFVSFDVFLCPLSIKSSYELVDMNLIYNHGLSF